MPVCPTPVCIRTHKNGHARTHVKDPVAHVRVRWITETPTDPPVGLASAALAAAVIALAGEGSTNFPQEFNEV